MLIASSRSGISFTARIVCWVCFQVFGGSPGFGESEVCGKLVCRKFLSPSCARVVIMRVLLTNGEVRVSRLYKLVELVIESLNNAPHLLKVC